MEDTHISFEWTQDYDKVTKILTHPRLYDWLTDDTAPTRDSFRAFEGFYYVLAEHYGDTVGVFVIAPQSSVCWQVHTALLPYAWGSLAVEIYKEGIQWVFANSECRKVVGNIRANNKLAIRLAERGGLTRIGINEKCVMKNGKLRDQVIMGICK